MGLFRRRKHANDQVVVEEAFDDAKEADADVLRIVRELGVDLRRPVQVGLDIAVDPPGEPEAVADILAAAGFRVVLLSDGGLHTLGFEVLRHPGPTDLTQLVDAIVSVRGGRVTGWGVQSPSMTLLQGVDHEDVLGVAEAYALVDELPAAWDVLYAALHCDDDLLPAMTACPLARLSADIGDHHGSDILSAWAAGPGVQVWGWKGAFAYAVEFSQYSQDLEETRPLFERVIAADPNEWGLPARIELADVLISSGDTGGARKQLRHVQAGPNTALAQRAGEELARL